MKIVRSIFVYSLVFVFLAESAGIQIIKDICVPCQNESVVVQMVYTHYESDCHDNCHDEDNSVANDVHNCNNHICFHINHEHEKDIQVLNKLPGFFGTNYTSLLKLLPVFDVMLNKHIENPLSFHKDLLSSITDRNKPILPDIDIQSILCSYLI